tara:strand:- start:93 stop:758 length:666 start_codon:yes stop_codon:yes gene_type:complete
MSEIILSQQALSFYSKLREKNYDTDSYNAMKTIYHDEIKPKFGELLEHLSKMLSVAIPQLDFDMDDDLGSPFVHGHAAKYAWGAITRRGKTKHTDLQFYVAMRFDYLRFGIYTKNEKKTIPVFGKIYRQIMNNNDEFLGLIDKLESQGIFLTSNITDDESGKPKIMNINRKYSSESILEDSTFNVMAGIQLDELEEVDITPLIIDNFNKLIPIYKFVLNLD